MIFLEKLRGVAVGEKNWGVGFNQYGGFNR